MKGLKSKNIKMGERIGCILQARMGSQRFPGKVLADIGGKSLLARCLDRLATSKYIKPLIVATTTRPEDDPICDSVLKRKQAKLFRGDEKNVLGRYYLAASYFKLDVIVRATGDNPFVDVNLVDHLIELVVDNPEIDYAATKYFPLGLGAEVIRFSALERSHRLANKAFEREHVTPYILRHPKRFRIELIEAEGLFHRPDLRLTVDTREDLETANAVHCALKGQIGSTEKLIAILDSHSEIKGFSPRIQQARI